MSGNERRTLREDQDLRLEAVATRRAGLDLVEHLVVVRTRRGAVDDDSLRALEDRRDQRDFHILRCRYDRRLSASSEGNKTRQRDERVRANPAVSVVTIATST